MIEVDVGNNEFAVFIEILCDLGEFPRLKPANLFKDPRARMMSKATLWTVPGVAEQIFNTLLQGVADHNVVSDRGRQPSPTVHGTIISPFKHEPSCEGRYETSHHPFEC